MSAIFTDSTIGIAVCVNTASEDEAISQLNAYLSALVRACVANGIAPLEADFSPTEKYDKGVIKAVGLNVRMTETTDSDTFSANWSHMQTLAALLRDVLPTHLAAVNLERGIAVPDLKAVYDGLPDIPRPLFPSAEIAMVRESYT